MHMLVLRSHTFLFPYLDATCHLSPLTSFTFKRRFPEPGLIQMMASERQVDDWMFGDSETHLSPHDEASLASFQGVPNFLSPGKLVFPDDSMVRIDVTIVLYGHGSHASTADIFSKMSDQFPDMQLPHSLSNDSANYYDLDAHRIGNFETVYNEESFDA
jgi:hypothetical protein